MKGALTGATSLAVLALALGACASTSQNPSTSQKPSSPASTRSTAPVPSASATGSAVPGRVELSAPLRSGAAYPGATGRAEYDQDGNQRELEVSLARIPQLAGQRVAVFVNGGRAGSVAVSGVGQAHADWDTEHGDSVPHVVGGNRVEVRTASGAVVVSGTVTREPED